MFAFLLIGMVIALIWSIIKFSIECGSNASKEDVKQILSDRAKESYEKRQAYWNHGMTRRDWFWWGRW